MKVGDVFKHRRSNYEVVAVFRDSGREFYVAKGKMEMVLQVIRMFLLIIIKN